ncbi:kynureninase [Galbibacter marinus]|uniref:Kynureninase n=1 Tax=Galbibacter marinus TaxID=555500 RepID=K2Q108_9FLAO|nr:kynureninase [Galbibacter marinus]EKF54581.1 kynureninase [Galbibacter marinus]
MEFKNTREFAQLLDSKDTLQSYKQEFIFPQFNNKNVLYFTGNSLGLQPKRTRGFLDEILNDWGNLAVEGHFYADKPWWDYHQRLAAPLAKVVGAQTSEITVMNTLTVNLHLLMVSFYQPTKKRYKIICEEKAFPSDQYMFLSQLRNHGLTPQDALIVLKKRPGENHWRTSDILEKIELHRDELALVLIGGVNYYNGQVFDIKTITKAAKQTGAMVGWDLAHAAGNIPLELHNWEVDFAAWCSYKYMNSGPGNASGVFINQKYHNRKDIARFEGWWGTKKETRFQMKPEFEPMENADAWQISNPAVMTMAPYLASLEMFEEVGMQALNAKSKTLTGYLEFILDDINSENKNQKTLEIITPKDRGCQLSLFVHGKGRELFDYLMNNGVIVDWREPNVIRLAPVPFYNSFEDLYEFGQILKAGI